MNNEAQNTLIAPVATQTPTNPHILWRQIVGLTFWAGVGNFFAGGLAAAILGLLVGGLTFADAWISGIYKLPTKRSLVNNSPMAWGIAMGLVLVVGYPLYIMNRNKLRTIAGTNILYRAVIVLGGLILTAGTLMLFYDVSQKYR